ncbi:hypothetical protein AAIH25_01285 [Arthrobacter crystallopoietes]|uniref:hypothetical protein n=1 Tax=Crystallibacter crystallopoietes TaxID=37928 RepID=UPI003D22A255
MTIPEAHNNPREADMGTFTDHKSSTKKRQTARKLGTAIAGISAIGLLSACGGSGAGASAGGQDVTVNASAPYGPDHVFSKGMVAFGDAVTEASDGSVSFDWNYGDSVVKQPDLAAALSDGIMDIGFVGPAFTPAEFPADAWASRLGIGGDTRPVVGVLASAAAMIEFGLTEPELAAEQQEFGLYPVLPRFQHFDNYQLLCKEPVDTLDAAAGKRVRVGGNTYAKEAENLGMIPVSLSGAEIYEGFERGVVDCFIGGEVDMLGLGLAELGKDYTAVNLPGWNSVSIDTGGAFHEELSDEQKKAFNAGIPAFLDELFTGYLEEQHQFFKDGAASGIEFHEPAADMQAKIDAHHDKVLSELKSSAPEGITDPSATVDRYTELQKKWVGIVEDLGYDQGVTTKAEWVEKFPENPQIDLGPWLDALNEEVLAEHRPVS